MEIPRETHGKTMGMGEPGQYYKHMRDPWASAINPWATHGQNYKPVRDLRGEPVCYDPLASTLNP